MFQSRGEMHNLIQDIPHQMYNLGPISIIEKSLFFFEEDITSHETRITVCRAIKVVVLHCIGLNNRHVAQTMI